MYDLITTDLFGQMILVGNLCILSRTRYGYPDRLSHLLSTINWRGKLHGAARDQIKQPSPHTSHPTPLEITNSYTMADLVAAHIELYAKKALKSSKYLSHRQFLSFLG